MDRQFTRKAPYVVSSHTTDPPSSITYSSVVSRDSVRIVFTLASLNDVEIRTADIGYAHEPNRYLGTNIEKVQLDEGSVEWSMTSK